MARAPDDDRLQDAIPERFELLDRLGSGAFGVVYRAFDQKHQTIVALKTLHQLQPRHLYNFKREFRSLADISHPNLVDLYELVADGEIWFFTMSYIDGVDFRTAMRHGRLEERATESNKTINPDKETVEVSGNPDPDVGETARAATLDSPADGGEADDEGPPPTAPPLDQAYLREALVDLVTGVQALHDYGMLHRDLKPGNVTVTPQGKAVVLDFGLVTDLRGPAGGHPDAEIASGITGTPRYLAPEIAWDQPLDEAADWYAVGVMIYEVLTGRPPVQADTAIGELYQKNEHPPTHVEEFRTDIDTDLATICMDLLTIDPDGRPGGRELLARLDVESAEAGRLRPGGQENTFVGREDSLERLETLATSTFRNERPSIVNIRGESGVGKSALAEQFLRNWTDAHPETTVLQGRCYENESVPYKALDGVIDELVPWLQDLPDDEVTELLGEGGTAVAKLFPVLKQVDAVFQADDIVVTKTEAQLRHKAFQAIGRLVRRISEDAPLIISIDDVQWGDEDSVLLLKHLLGNDDPPAVMLMTTWRDEDVEASSFLEPFLEMQRDLAPTVPTEELELSALDEDEVRQMARHIVDSSSRSPEDGETPDIDFDRIVEESAGNPLFVDELSRHTAEAGVFDSDVTEFDAILRERLDGLAESARRILDVVALAGQPLERDLLRRIVGDDSEILANLSMLRGERLIRSKGTEGDHLEPYHDRIRDTLTERLSEDQQRGIHLELAQALLSMPQADPETIGMHLEGAGEFERAADYLVEAADNAADALAFERAVQLLERALDLGNWSTSRLADLQQRLGEMYAALGLGRRAAEMYFQAAEAADGLDVRARRIKAVEQLLRAGEVNRGTDLLYEELEALGFSPVDNRALMLTSSLYRRWKLERRGFDFELQSPETLDRRQRLLIEALTMATLMHGIIDVPRGTYFHYHALPLALEGGYPSKIALLLCQQVAQDVAIREAPERRKQLLETARDLLPECRHEPGHVRSYVVLEEGMLDYFTSRWRPALALIRRARETLEVEMPGSVWWSAVYRFFECDCLHRLGAFDELREIVPASLQAARERDDGFNTVLFRTKKAQLALCDDAPERAGEELTRAKREWTREGYHIHDFWRERGGIDTALYRGEIEAAWSQVREARGRLRRSLLIRSYPVRTFVWGLYGRIAAALTGTATGWQYWHARYATWRARRKLRAIGTDVSEAFADVIEGQLALAAGEIDAADDAFERAQTGFERADMAFHAHALELRRGQMLQDDQGDSLEQNARAWMDEKGIEAPDKMARLVAIRASEAKLPAAENGDAN